MIIPKTFQLAGSKWKVVHRKDLQDLGNCVRDKRQILLQIEQDQISKELAFTHELVHAIKFTMGEQEHSEKEVDAFGHLLHQFLTTQK